MPKWLLPLAVIVTLCAVFWAGRVWGVADTNAKWQAKDAELITANARAGTAAVSKEATLQVQRDVKDAEIMRAADTLDDGPCAAALCDTIRRLYAESPL